MAKFYKRNLINQTCIIDEAWDLMSGGNIGQFIETGYRRARVYAGSISNALRFDDYLESQKRTSIIFKENIYEENK